MRKPAALPQDQLPVVAPGLCSIDLEQQRSTTPSSCERMDLRILVSLSLVRPPAQVVVEDLVGLRDALKES